MVERWIALAVAAGLALGACERDRTVSTRCAVGERPGYFVPGDGPATVVGCARLGVSGKRIEFSGNDSACINPAYSGRGQRGFFIPAICELDPPLTRFAVRDARQPRQGGYGYVIWGTAGTASEVTAHFEGGTARAAIIRVGAPLARRFGAPPFRLFVVELPPSAAHGPVVTRPG